MARRVCNVVIVDDFCTTGGSTVLAIERAREAGMNVLGAICPVDREQGGRESIESEHKCPFDRLFTMKEFGGGVRLFTLSRIRGDWIC